MKGDRRLNGAALAVRQHVLAAYASGEDVTPEDLCRRAGVSRATFYRAVSVLVAAGVLEEDRRTPTVAAEVELTRTSPLQEWAGRLELNSSAWRPVLVELVRSADRYGWVRKCSVDQLAQGAGLSRSTVLRALSGLTGQGVITPHQAYDRPTDGGPAFRRANSYQLNAGPQIKHPDREGRTDHPAAHIARAERLLASLPWWKRCTITERRLAVSAVAQRITGGWPEELMTRRLTMREGEDGTVRDAYTVFRSRMRKLPVRYQGTHPADAGETRQHPAPAPATLMLNVSRLPECPDCRDPLFPDRPHYCPPGTVPVRESAPGARVTPLPHPAAPWDQPAPAWSGAAAENPF